MFRPARFLACEPMFGRQNDLAQEMLSGLDLLIDLATLGEYGLEPLSADGPCSGRTGRRAGWEAPARPAAGSGRRASCAKPPGRAAVPLFAV